MYNAKMFNLALSFNLKKKKVLSEFYTKSILLHFIMASTLEWLVDNASIFETY